MLDLVEHRGELSPVAAAVVHCDSHNDLTVGSGGQLNVVSRMKPAISHLHHPRLGIGARCSRLAALSVLPFGLVGLSRCRLFVLLLLIDFRQLLQRFGQALFALLGRSLIGRAPTHCQRPGKHRFRPQGLGPGLALVPGTTSASSGGEKIPPGTGSYSHPVLRHSRQFHQTLIHQHCHTIGEQVIEQIHSRATEIRQRVMIQVHPAADPTIGVMRLGQPFDLRALPTPSTVAYSHSAVRIWGSMAADPPDLLSSRSRYIAPTDPVSPRMPIHNEPDAPALPCLKIHRPKCDVITLCRRHSRRQPRRRLVANCVFSVKHGKRNVCSPIKRKSDRAFAWLGIFSQALSVSVHDPSHDLLVGAHVGRRDIRLRTDKV